MGPSMVTVLKPGIYGIGIPKIIHQIRHFPRPHGDMVEAFTSSGFSVDLSDWMALLRTGDGLNWWQHDCGLEITQETWDRAGINPQYCVCPRCQPKYQYVWTFRDGLSR